MSNNIYNKTSKSNQDLYLNESEQTSSPEEVEIEFENPISIALSTYSSRIINSLKKSISYCINTEKIANESLLNLYTQNDQINRIKTNLNQSHESISISEKLVDKYVSALGWISSTIRWNNSVKLDIKSSEEQFKEIKSKYPDIDNSNDNLTSGDLQITTDPESDLLSHTTTGLNSLVTNMKNNRLKTDLLSDIIVHQNNELERINSSAQTLKDRVSNMNKILKR